MKSNKFNTSLLALIGRQFIHFKYFYLAAFIALFCTHRTQVEIPLMAKNLGSELLKMGGTEMAVWPFFVMAIMIVIFRTLSRLLFFYPARIQQKELRQQLIEMLENAHPARYKKFSQGQIYQILFNDLNHIRALIGFLLLQIGNLLIACAVIIPRLSQISPELLVAYTPMLVGVIVFSLTMAFTRHLYKEVQDAQGEVQNFLIESYDGKKTIKTFAAENAFINLFHSISFRELKAFYRAGRLSAFSMPLIRLSVGLSLLWGASILHRLNLPVVELITFSGFVFLLLEPLMFVSWVGAITVSSWAAWKRVTDLTTALEATSEEEIKLMGLNQGALERIKIPFWDNSIELNCKEKQWTAIIGKTGEGKSYILTMMATCFRAHGKKICLVGQSPFLYNDTVEKNIFLGKNPSGEEKKRAIELLRIFALDSLTNDTSELLTLIVGEKGKRLSGGQAKRLALIRSLMSEAEILLWDDPFSSVDAYQEKIIIAEVKKFASTVILTGHRLSTVSCCDEVILVDKHIGIKEQGKVKEQLVQDKKIYEYLQTQLA